MCESLSLFSEPTKVWFEHAFGQPTEAQAQAWPAIHSGRNVLVIAPTGSGKTLTSFKTARIASLLPYIDKVLFVVDRKDLD